MSTPLFVVFGASGRVGRRVVQGLVRAGHAVRGVVHSRTEPVMTHPLYHQQVADIGDLALVLSAVEGAHAVACAVGGGGRNLDQPRTLMTRGLDHVAQAMAVHGCSRLVTVATKGVLPDEAGEFLGDKGSPALLHYAFLDHRDGWLALRRSDLDWVTLCPPRLLDGEGTGRILLAVNAFPERGGPIEAGDVARVVVTELLSPSLHRVRVGVASAPDVATGSHA